MPIAEEPARRPPLGVWLVFGWVAFVFFAPGPKVDRANLAFGFLISGSTASILSSLDKILAVGIMISAMPRPSAWSYRLILTMIAFGFFNSLINAAHIAFSLRFYGEILAAWSGGGARYSRGAVLFGSAIPALTSIVLFKLLSANKSYFYSRPPAD